MPLPGQLTEEQSAPARGYRTLTNAGGTGVDLPRPFRGIFVVTAGAVTLKDPQSGESVAFGSLSAGIWDLGGNHVVAAPADLILLY